MGYECSQVTYARDTKLVDVLSEIREQGGGIFVFDCASESAYVFPSCDEVRAVAFADEYLRQDYFIAKLGPDADDKAYANVLYKIMFEILTH